MEERMSISFNVLSDEYKFGFGISDLKICDENCKQVNISNIASEHLLSKLGFHMDVLIIMEEKT